MTNTSNAGHAGIDIDKVLENLAEGVDYGRVPATLYGNKDVYERELNQIFARAWVFMAHESEIPNKGDYVSRKIGEDDFIVTHDADGQFNVLYDACRHRGVKVARASAGNTENFRCPYHGWTYNLKGHLTGAPLWKNAFGDMDKMANSLVPAAKVGVYQGMIFATLDAGAPSWKSTSGAWPGIWT
ncbi:aromatic ring-hydroxylating oxygenase subunit alpha [Neopusillimonas aromaticivorans]|uniref:aromatic ring-hydroxylating oxygenase subunit alpha n=1 Tax=Neopusillimonas aromaticivorans TaxID=2979868 RepID=UPI0025941EF0|nr:Rieske 2Fe-2S domain-containing protein [Neopusillimonas aromaticivorans]WJJ92592.1 Rieske 2Fe-2S domain-containing protein [Neopusillimonas aromaticivorans]